LLEIKTGRERERERERETFESLLKSGKGLDVGSLHTDRSQLIEV
jgi:hypothetical protein